MSAWLMSIVGVVSVGVLLDILIPEGEINKYIRGVFGIVVVLVIVAPLPNLLGKDFDIGKIFEGQMLVDESFVANVESEQTAALERRVTAELSREYPVQKVRIFHKIQSKEIDIVKVYMASCDQNIDSNSAKNNIIIKVANMLDVDKGAVRVYAKGN